MSMTTTWQLLGKETGAPIGIGDRVTTFRGELFELVGFQPPKHSGSEGHVSLSRPCTHTADDHQRIHWCQGEERCWPYASVIGARYVEIPD